MASSEHEEFVALCALSTSGDLTEDEWHRLEAHLLVCASCQLAMAEYELLAREVMPAVAASALMERDEVEGKSEFSLEEAERRLMARLDLEQEKSAKPESGVVARRRWKAPLILLTAASMTLAYMSFYHPRLRSRGAPIQGQPSVAATSLPAVVPQAVNRDLTLQVELEQTKTELSALRKRASLSGAALDQAQAKVAELNQRLDAAQTQATQERSELDRQIAVARSESQALREKADTASDAVSQRTREVASLEERVRTLNTALEQKEHVLSQDQELLAHDRDIRDLIGARDLYMAEIYDVAQTGVTKKPFGRVFYTKDKSLIFYGYDLDQQTGLKQSVTFQAWGSGGGEQNVNLGLFYQDESKRRWILKFNDANTLAHLNSVFVTAEPKGGSVKPTGKPLLTTYLRLEPNHP